MYPCLNGATAGGGLALPEFIQLAKESGFAGVEFGIGAVADLIDREGEEAARALFEDAGILPGAFGLPTEWRKDENTFDQGLEGLPRLARAAQAIGCTRCCTWVLPDGGALEEYKAQSLARFARIAKTLNDYDVHLGLEFLGPAHFRTNPNNVWFYDIAGALEAADDVMAMRQTENVGLLVDAWHWYTGGGTIMDLASIPVEQIVHVHINDAPKIPREEQKDSVRLLPGDSGVMDMTGFLQTLAALGYEGPVAVETFSEELRALPPQEAAKRAAIAVKKVWDAARI